MLVSFIRIRSVRQKLDDLPAVDLIHHVLEGLSISTAHVLNLPESFDKLLFFVVIEVAIPDFEWLSLVHVVSPHHVRCTVNFWDIYLS